MKQGKIKSIFLYFLVICLSILHVHCSIDTQDNGMNPATLSLMLIYSMQLTTDIYEIVVFYSIQFVITVLISSILLKYRNLFLWLIDYVLVLIICIGIGSIYSEINNSLENLHITNIYGNYYGYGPAAFTTAIICSFLQLFVIFIYPVLSYLRSFMKKNKAC